jgi:hypothetical protein
MQLRKLLAVLSAYWRVWQFSISGEQVAQRDGLRKAKAILATI